MTSNSHDVFRDWFPFVLVFLPGSGLILLPFPCEDFNQVFSFQFYYWVLFWGEQPESHTFYAVLCGMREGQCNREQHENAGPLKLHYSELSPLLP